MTHTNEKAPSACDTEGFDTDTHKLDSATTTQHSKAITALLAELVLAGHTVHKLRCSDFLVCKYGYSHYAQDFDALLAFAFKLGVRK